jgi:hypothetical protein
MMMNAANTGMFETSQRIIFLLKILGDKDD